MSIHIHDSNEYAFPALGVFYTRAQRREKWEKESDRQRERERERERERLCIVCPIYNPSFCVYTQY